ncbi:MAG: diguanylate cyclase domain-containing protein [Pseudomonadota bacterium]
MAFTAPDTAAVPSRPDWRVFLLLPLMHFASVKLTMSLAMSPENEVVVWLPNAVLLAALLHWQGARGGWMAALVLVSDIYANIPAFPPLQATLVSLCNLSEVAFTYLLMRRLGVSPGLERIHDFGRFLLAGPLLGSLGASLLAGVVLLTLDRVSAPYSTLTLLWWFGDALGLLIYTPLLLAFLRRDPEGARGGPAGIAMMALTLAFAAMLFTQPVNAGAAFHVALTPHLLLLPLLWVAVRCGTRCTALTVALIALGAAWSVTTGHQPFGAASPHDTILRAQEYILTLSIIGMGLSILLREQRALAQDLEDKVRERTVELEASNRRLAELSATDSLTGIANRRRFDETMEAEWARARRSGEPLALCLLDVDLFKPYNDHYGHLAGDDCLRLVAEVINAHVRRASDLVARYGGEEFAFIIPGVDADGALATAHAVCAALQARGEPHVRSPFGVLTASIGVAVMVPTDDDTPDQLVRLADQALYEAKRAGRNRVVRVASEDVEILRAVHRA